jgi:hypothetical protein
VHLGGGEDWSYEIGGDVHTKTNEEAHTNPPTVTYRPISYSQEMVFDPQSNPGA